VRYVALALACEGSTDYEFLGPLLARHVETLIAEDGEENVEIGSVIPVLPSGRFGNSREGVSREFAEGRIFADILFLHTDGGGDAKGAHQYRVDPLRSVLAELGETPSLVAVVPVRETEAWMLADSSAIESTLGLNAGVVQITEKPKNVDSILDPKSELRRIAQVVEANSGRRRNIRRRGDRVNRLYSTLAADVKFHLLREVPSFVQYETSLRSILVEKGLIK